MCSYGLVSNRTSGNGRLLPISTAPGISGSPTPPDICAIALLAHVLLFLFVLKVLVTSGRLVVHRHVSTAARTVDRRQDVHHTAACRSPLRVGLCRPRNPVRVQPMQTPRPGTGRVDPVSSSFSPRTKHDVVRHGGGRLPYRANQPPARER